MKIKKIFCAYSGIIPLLMWWPPCLLSLCKPFPPNWRSPFFLSLTSCCLTLCYLSTFSSFCSLFRFFCLFSLFPLCLLISLPIWFFPLLLFLLVSPSPPPLYLIHSKPLHYYSRHGCISNYVETHSLFVNFKLSPFFGFVPIDMAKAATPCSTIAPWYMSLPLAANGLYC